tara:strand:- start:481 stop:1056 length:576 start_codon:yes stop_codon:yes gene_type:complete
MSFSTDAQKYITSFWQQKIDDIKDSLKASGKWGSGVTGQSVSMNFSASGKAYKIQLLMPDYYQFLDEGVKGTENKRSNTGRFAYKSKQPPVDVIRSFMLTRGIVGKNYRKIKNIRNKALKKRSIEKELNSVAFAIARSIKQKGLERTDFYSDNVNASTLKEFEAGVLGIFSNAVINIIEQKGDKIEVNKLF